jgi:hypothetical protein
MPVNFTTHITVDKRSLLAVIVPVYRPDGTHYEVNVKGYPRFYMSYSPLGRYDATGDEAGNIPYEMVLAISDAIEASKK